MKIFNKILILTIGVFLIACEDVIEVDLNTAPQRLVIDASIDWVKNTNGNEQKIVLSTTTGYYNTEFPTVSGANITVTNTIGTVFNYIETSGTGEYICTDFEPVIGETYTLSIQLNGETYTATETLIATAAIEDTVEQDNAGGFGGDEIEITYYYQDNGTEENYYLYRFIDSNVAFPQDEVEDDENSQGNLTPVYYSNEDMEPGDVVNFKLYGISRRYHEYFKKLLIASGSGGGPFQTTPTAVRGNIVNQTNSDNYTFGYFRLTEVDVKDYTIE